MATKKPKPISTMKQRAVANALTYIRCCNTVEEVKTACQRNIPYHFRCTRYETIVNQVKDRCWDAAHDGMLAVIKVYEEIIKEFNLEKDPFTTLPCSTKDYMESLAVYCRYQAQGIDYD